MSSHYILSLIRLYTFLFVNINFYLVRKFRCVQFSLCASFRAQVSVRKFPCASFVVRKFPCASFVVRKFRIPVFSIVGTVTSISDLPKLCSFVVFETLYRIRETRKMGYFSFSNRKSVNNEKRRKTLVFLNGFLHGWHSGQYF